MTNNELLWMLRNNCGVSEAAVNAAHQAADRIEELEVKLEKALEAMMSLVNTYDAGDYGRYLRYEVENHRQIITELKGETNELQSGETAA